MRTRAILMFLCSTLFLCQLFAANPIILVSIDGLRPDAIKKARAKNLLHLIKEGTSFCNARTVRPSITLPSHTSMVTGLDPTKHGITWNSYRPSYGPVRHQTVLEIANNAGFHTAAIVAKEKLLHLNRPNSVDHFEVTEREGEKIAEAFVDYVQEYGLPDVTFLHLPDPDKMGHRLLWMSPFYFKGVRDADDALGVIIETARNAAPPEKSPTIIVTADHGGTGFSHLADIDKNNIIPFIAAGEHIAEDVVKEDPVRVYDAAATILSLLNLSIPDYWDGSPAPIIHNTVSTQFQSRIRPQHMRARFDY